jgi:hypothetical protein
MSHFTIKEHIDVRNQLRMCFEIDFYCAESSSVSENVYVISYDVLHTSAVGPYYVIAHFLSAQPRHETADLPLALSGR